MMMMMKEFLEHLQTGNGKPFGDKINLSIQKK
jgi:hypothetical protein